MFKLDSSVDRDYSKYSLFEGVMYCPQKNKKWVFEIFDCHAYHGRAVREMSLVDRMLVARQFIRDDWCESRYIALSRQTYSPLSKLSDYREHITFKRNLKLPRCDGLILKSQKLVFKWKSQTGDGGQAASIPFGDIEQKLVKK